MVVLIIIESISGEDCHPLAHKLRILLLLTILIAIDGGGSNDASGVTIQHSNQRIMNPFVCNTVWIIGC